MKVTTFKQEINGLTTEQLLQKSLELKKELFTLRLNASTAHVKDYSQFNKLRKDIARVSTLISARELSK